MQVLCKARSVLLCAERCQLTATRTFLYSKKKGVDRKTLAKLQKQVDITPQGLTRWWRASKHQKHHEDHKFRKERLFVLGPDLATSYFIIARGGKVKFVGDPRWHGVTETGGAGLPGQFSDAYQLEAIDASHMTLFPHSFDNFVNLDHLRFLDLSGSSVDDWCLDRLVQFRATLEVLGLNGCPAVTERGLSCLHKMTSLRQLHVDDMSGVRHQPLIRLLLEEALPQCEVSGLSDTDNTDHEDLPSFLSSCEQFATSKVKS